MKPGNKTKQKIKSGEVVFGLISGINDPKVAELAGFLGFDFYMIDTEHSPMTPAQAVQVVRGCNHGGLTPLVRVSQKDPKAILPYLDGGACGVMMPGIESAADVQMLVNGVKYPPVGNRGLGVVRAADYLVGDISQADYISWANQNTLVLPQFEDAAFLDILPEMAAVPEVDGFVIGPRDLSLSMGYPDGPQHPAVQQVIDEAIRIMRAAGVHAGLTAGTHAAAKAQIARGATIILTSLPGLMKSAVHAFFGQPS